MEPHNHDLKPPSADDAMVYNELVSVESICDAYIQLYRENLAPPVSEFAAQYPKFQNAVLELLPTILMMEKARNRNLDARKDGRVTRGPNKISDLGDFKIISEVGRGGMGIVYKAHQESLNRTVALKLLPKFRLTDQQVVRFKREAATAAKLHHNHIAPIYAIGKNDGFHYYAMQLIEGNALDSFISETRESNAAQLSQLQILEIGKNIASALQYAYHHDVLHRDVKPANLVLDNDNNIWMTDFGLAISMEHDLAATQGNRAGTFRYMSPEKITGGEDSISGDIYSLGITLIELLSGKPAFLQNSRPKLTDAILNSNFSITDANGKPIRGDLRAILVKATDADPGKRYSTPADLMNDLEKLTQRQPVSANPPTPVGIAWRWVKRNRALTAASAIAIEALVAALLISTNAYYQLQSTYVKVEEQKIVATQSADLASRAMDEMFESLSHSSGDAELVINSENSTSKLTNRSAQLAATLSKFYANLSSQNQSNAKISLKAILARIRAAELNERIGNYQVALLDYLASREAAIARESKQNLENRNENSFLLAQIANRIGRIWNLLDDLEAADREHQLAIQRLIPLVESDPGHEQKYSLELARSYYLKARRTRPGMGPKSLPPMIFSRFAKQTETSDLSANSNFDQEKIESLNRAIKIAKQILSISENSENSRLIDSTRFLLALCYREIADDNWSRRTVEGRYQHADAIRVLGDLHEKHPQQHLFQFELMKTLAEINVFALDQMTETTIAEAKQSLSRAIDVGLRLSADQPEIVDYQIELIHSYFKLAKIFGLESELADNDLRGELRKQQRASLRSAIERQVLLSRISPENHAYVVWSAKFLLTLAACEGVQGNTAIRQRLLDRANKFLSTLPADFKSRPQVFEVIKEAEWLGQNPTSN